MFLVICVYMCLCALYYVDHLNVYISMDNQVDAYKYVFT